MFDLIARKLRTPYLLARIVIVLLTSLYAAYGGEIDPRVVYSLFHQARQLDSRPAQKTRR